MYEDKCTLSDCLTHLRTTSSERVLWQFASGWESHFLQSTLQPKGKRVDQTIYALWRVHSHLCKTRRTFACFHWNRLYPERRGSWKRRRQKSNKRESLHISWSWNRCNPSWASSNFSAPKDSEEREGRSSLRNGFDMSWKSYLFPRRIPPDFVVQ